MSLTIDGREFDLTDEQVQQVRAAWADYLEGAKRVDELLKDDPLYDGKHLCHTRHPYKEVESRYTQRIREIVGLV